mmetsp:Transcript_10042/g.16443  ORF Transcript_10042/g.16443 Transcript_10042/m.16443 type:complete len:203 (+) Transcript_10042:3496-4104(+)
MIFTIQQIRRETHQRNIIITPYHTPTPTPKSPRTTQQTITYITSTRILNQTTPILPKPCVNIRQQTITDQITMQPNRVKTRATRNLITTKQTTPNIRNLIVIKVQLTQRTTLRPQRTCQTRRALIINTITTKIQTHQTTIPNHRRKRKRPHIRTYITIRLKRLNRQHTRRLGQQSTTQRLSTRSANTILCNTNQPRPTNTIT